MADASSRADTAERLLEAAEAEFASRGYEGARLEDIAAAVGVRRASLLYHFASKQELYDRVLERAFADFRLLLTSAIDRASASHAERLDDAIGRAVDVFARRPGFARLLLRDALDREGLSVERARVHVAPLLAIGDAFLRAGQAAGEFRDDLSPRDAQLFAIGAIVHHAVMTDELREVLWGDRHASGRGLRRHRDAVREMVRALVVRPRVPA